MKKIFDYIISIIGWIIITYFITPVIGAIGWIFWSIIIYQNLFVPEAFLGTIKAFLILLLISFLYFLILRLWTIYNYKKYFLKNKRKVILLKSDWEKIDFRKLSLKENQINEYINFNC